MAASRIGLPVLFKHQHLAAPSACLLQSSHRNYRPRVHKPHDPRADKPWFQKLQREKFKEDKKTITRKIDEMFGLEPAIPIPEREPFLHSDKRSVMDETHELYKETPIFSCVRRTNFHEGVPQAAWLTKSKLMGEGTVG